MCNIPAHNSSVVFHHKVQAMPEEIEAEYDVAETVEVIVLCARDVKYCYRHPVPV